MAKENQTGFQPKWTADRTLLVVEFGTLFFLILILVAAVHVSFYGVTTTYPRDLLVWRDDQLEIVVYEDPESLVSQRPTLLVKKEGKVVASRIVEDDLALKWVALIRYGDWYLVSDSSLKGGRIWGGYNSRTGEIWGEHQWDRLPIQIYDGKGTILTTEKVRD